MRISRGAMTVKRRCMSQLDWTPPEGTPGADALPEGLIELRRAAAERLER